MKAFLRSILLAVAAINLPSSVLAGNLCPGPTGSCPTDVDSTRVAAAPGWGSAKALDTNIKTVKRILAAFDRPTCQLRLEAEKISKLRENVKLVWEAQKNKVGELEATWRSYVGFTRGIRIQIDGSDLGPSRYERIENYEREFKKMEKFYRRPISDLVCKEIESHWVIANDRGFGWHDKRKYLEFLESELVYVRGGGESKEGTEFTITDKIAIEKYRMKVYNASGRTEYLKKLRTAERKAEKLQKKRKPRPGQKDEAKQANVHDGPEQQEGEGQNHAIREDPQQNAEMDKEEDKPEPEQIASNNPQKAKPHLRNLHRFHHKPRVSSKTVQEWQKWGEE